VPGSYRINVSGRLGVEMIHLLADLRPDVRADTTVLYTDTIDQASLHGTLGRIRDLGLSIDAVSMEESSD